MYSDRELLELAARAAGHTLGPDWDCLPEGIFINGDDRFSGTEWNPLTDDGDALRLAGALWISLSQMGDDVAAESYERRVRAVEVIKSNSGCRNKATRRAIVRAAAAIGEVMK